MFPIVPLENSSKRFASMRVTVLVVLIWSATYAFSSDHVPQADPKTTPSYLIYYSSKYGIHRSNTKTNSDSLIIPLSEYNIQKRISPDKAKIALSYTEDDSSKLVIVDVLSSKTWHVMSIPQDDSKYYIFSFEWSPDSKNLGVGFYSEKKVGKTYVLDRGGIFTCDCAASDQFGSFDLNK